MMRLCVTYRSGASEIIDINIDKRLQDLKEYFNCETVEILSIYYP